MSMIVEKVRLLKENEKMMRAKMIWKGFLKFQVEIMVNHLVLNGFFLNVKVEIQCGFSSNMQSDLIYVLIMED